MADVRRLTPGDTGWLDAYLSRHPATSLFLRSNLRRTAKRRGPAPPRAYLSLGFRMIGDYGIALLG